MSIPRSWSTITTRALLAIPFRSEAVRTSAQAARPRPVGSLTVDRLLPDHLAQWTRKGITAFERLASLDAGAR